jgi:hypothetical protein
MNFQCTFHFKFLSANFALESFVYIQVHLGNMNFEGIYKFEGFSTKAAFVDCKFGVDLNMLSNVSFLRKNFSANVALEWCLRFVFAGGWLWESDK